MTERLRLLIVGGYGAFGGRIVQLLEGEPSLVIIVAGRSCSRAQAFCQHRFPAAQLVPTAFDRDGDCVEQLASVRPDILIDASGPFQSYGARPYRLLEACIAGGVNYLDLADSADFVAGVTQFDSAACAARLFVLSGASSFPVLSAAAVAVLTADLASLHSIRAGLAPSPYAGVGPSVVRATASYAGRPIPLKRGGGAAVGYPFTEQMRFTIAPPGVLPLQSRLFSLVEVPDIRILPERWPEVKEVWVGASPVPAVLHRLMIMLAWLVRLRLLPGLSWLAPAMHPATRYFRWGEHRSGMFVEVEGHEAADMPIRRSWHLVAEGDAGPLIPAMAVAGIVRKVLAGRAPLPGARAAAGALDLDDFETFFRGRAICWGVRQDVPHSRAPLYERVLGQAWDRLAPEIRQMHEVRTAATAEGRASVERGSSLLARLAAAVIGFPKSAPDTPVRVEFEITAGGDETWTRRFGDETFSSIQSPGRRRSDRLICERFGPLTFAMALVLDGPRLRLVLQRWSAFGVPLPMWLCPRSAAYETSEAGRFRFHVEISHPLTGLIVRYRGWLAPPARLQESNRDQTALQSGCRPV